MAIPTDTVTLTEEQRLVRGSIRDICEEFDREYWRERSIDGEYPHDFVETLAASSPVMIAMGKEAYYHQAGMSFDEALGYAKEVIALMAMSEDTEEGIEAQLMDREPEWAGR